HLATQRVIATNSAICQSKAPASGTFKVYQFCLAGVSRASGAFLYPRASGTFKNRYLREYVSASLSAIVKTDKMQHRLITRRPFRRNNSAAQNPGGVTFDSARSFIEAKLRKHPGIRSGNLYHHIMDSYPEISLGEISFRMYMRKLKASMLLIKGYIDLDGLPDNSFFLDGICFAINTCILQ
ncbi:MAG: hypothetical protein WC190_02085, partial [Candidatus Cloacimonadaceae bacterium]